MRERPPFCEPPRQLRGEGTRERDGWRLLLRETASRPMTAVPRGGSWALVTGRTLDALMLYN